MGNPSIAKGIQCFPVKVNEADHLIKVTMSYCHPMII